jgi:hypothetical protein
MRSALFWNFTQRRLVVSCRPFGTTIVVVKFSQRCWWRFKSSGTFHPVNWSVYIIQDQQSKMALHFTKTSVTLHPSTGRNLHQHLWENVTSHRREDHAGLSYCVWRVFYGSVKITAALTKAPYWTYFPFCALWYIKTLVNTNKCTILQTMYSFYYM